MFGGVESGFGAPKMGGGTGAAGITFFSFEMGGGGRGKGGVGIGRIRGIVRKAARGGGVRVGERAVGEIEIVVAFHVILS